MTSVDKPIFEFIGGVAPSKQKSPGIPINVAGPAAAESLGLYVLSGAEEGAGKEEQANQYAVLNFTGPPGSASGLYYSTVFQMNSWKYHVSKVDEWIEVSPVHKAYYERTMATKQMLEGVIKSGLASAASSVADYELVKHDLRKYHEILGYFAEPSGRQHSLRAMFVDSIDVHTDLPGQPLSLKSIAPRWPTIIADFLKLADDDLEPDTIAKKYNLSKVEGVVLSTKNRLYKNWKEMFLTTAKERYTTLHGLVNARKKSIEEYKLWLKPYIARYKMTKTGTELSSERANVLKSFMDITGQSTFSNYIRLWAWKPLRSIEPKKSPAELQDKWWVYPYDDWMRHHYVLNTKKGLANIYPWLMDDRKYCPQCKSYYPSNKTMCDKCSSYGLEARFYGDQLMETDILKNWSSFGFSPAELYYYIVDMKVSRSGLALPGGEVEDISFDFKGYLASQNVMAVKALELRCREIELEKYIDEMLGTSVEGMSVEEYAKQKMPGVFGDKPKVETQMEKFQKELAQISNVLGLKPSRVPSTPSSTFSIIKSGPYEKVFFDRITKQYLVPAGGMFGSLGGFIKSEMGVC